MKSTLPVLLLTPLLLAGCTTTSGQAPAPTPSGRIAVMPGPKKSLAAFDADERKCRAWADSHLDQTPDEAATQATVGGAIGGAALGAGAGALIGSTSGHVGQGAAIGAASGLLLGTLAGASAGDRDAAQQQRRFDVAYAQCMKAQGNTVDAPLPPRRVVVVEEDAPPPVVVYETRHYHRW